MANLFDGCKGIPKSTLAKLTAEMQTYTIFTQLHMGIQYLLYGGYIIIKKLMELFHRSIPLFHVKKWDERFHQHYDSLILLSTSQMEEALQQTLKKKIGNSGGRADNSDALSAAVTKFAAKGIRKSELQGLSIAEKNDYIFRKYPNQPGKNEQKSLKIWLIAAVFLFIAAVFLMGISGEWVKGLVLIALVEFGWGSWSSYQIRISQVMHFVWLAASGYGQPFAISAERVPGAGKGQEEKRQEERSLRAYQTLLMLAFDAEKAKRKLLGDKASVQKTIADNNNRIRSLQTSREEEALRMLQDKQKENALLADRNRILETQISQIEVQLRELTKQIGEREKQETEKLCGGWQNNFPRLRIPREIAVQVIKQFEYEDISKIERRFWEICSTIDPYAQAESRNGRYEMTFRTKQGDIASLFFVRPQKGNGGIQIVQIDRNVPLKIVPLTTEELVEIFKANDRGESQKYRELIQQLQAKEGTIADLCQKKEKLQSQKKEAEKKLKANLVHVSNLEKIIDEKTKECERLKQQLIIVGREKGDISEIRKKYEDCHRELLRLTQESADLEKELSASMKEYKKLEEQNASLRDEIEKKRHEITESRDDFLRQIKDIEASKNKEIESLTCQYKAAQGQMNTCQAMYDKATREKKGDKETIAKLEKSIRQSEDIIREKNNEIQEVKKELNELYELFEEEEKKKKTEAAVVEEKPSEAFVPEIEQALEGLEKKGAKVLKQRWSVFLANTEVDPGVYKEIIKKGYVSELAKIEQKLFQLDVAEDPMVYNERGTVTATGEAHFHINLKDVCLLVMFRVPKEKRGKKVIITKITDHGDSRAFK